MIELNLTPEQIAKLGLTPETMTPEAVTAAITKLLDAPAADGDTAAKLTELATERDQLKTTLAEVQGKLGTLEAAAQQQLADELAKELAEYDLDEETAGIVKGLPPEQRKPLLAKLPKKAAPTEVKEEKKTVEKTEQKEPPAAIHDPNAVSSGASETEIAAAIKARVAELQKADPRAAYAQLFTTAEKEIRAKAAKGEPLTAS